MANQHTALTKLTQQVQRLKHDASAFDQTKHFEKNRFLQNKQGLFSEQLFNTRSLLLSDYVNEISQSLASLPPEQHRHTYNYALEKLSEQVVAVIKVLHSTSVWRKENKQANRPQKRYQKVVKHIVKRSHELYQELTETQDFERRLLDMISTRKLELEKANNIQSAQLNREILALHGRLGRCRKALTAIEEQIQLAEKNS